jgi:hypothetical protein
MFLQGFCISSVNYVNHPLSVLSTGQFLSLLGVYGT